MAALAQKDCRAAVRAFEAVKGELRNDPELLFNAAKAYECAGDLQKALESLRAFDRHAPDQPEIRKAIGSLLYRIEQAEERRRADEKMSEQKRVEEDARKKEEETRRRAALQARRQDVSGRWSFTFGIVEIRVALKQEGTALTGTYLRKVSRIAGFHEEGQAFFAGRREGDTVTGRMTRFYGGAAVSCMDLTMRRTDEVTLRLESEGEQLGGSVPRYRHDSSGCSLSRDGNEWLTLKRLD